MVHQAITPQHSRACTDYHGQCALSQCPVPAFGTDGNMQKGGNSFLVILHAALDETFFCACLRFGNKWTCACCCFSPADAATFASSPSTGTSVKVWNFRVNKLSNSARWSLCACARHCWIAA